MSCPVCGASTAQVWNEGERKAVACNECGRYNISGSVLAVQAANGYRFDVEQTRRWFESRRQVQDIPVITNQTVRWAV